MKPPRNGYHYHARGTHFEVATAESSATIDCKLTCLPPETEDFPLSNQKSPAEAGLSQFCAFRRNCWSGQCLFAGSHFFGFAFGAHHFEFALFGFMLRNDLLLHTGRRFLKLR
jgi:hypothetical protein